MPTARTSSSGHLPLHTHTVPQHISLPRERRAPVGPRSPRPAGRRPPLTPWYSLQVLEVAAGVLQDLTQKLHPTVLQRVPAEAQVRQPPVAHEGQCEEATACHVQVALVQSVGHKDKGGSGPLPSGRAMSDQEGCGAPGTDG